MLHVMNLHLFEDTDTQALIRGHGSYKGKLYSEIFSTAPSIQV